MKLLQKLAAGLLAVTMAVPAFGAVQAGADTVIDMNDPEMRRQYAEVITSFVNDTRRENGLSELQLVPEVCEYAQVRAVDLETSFAHERPDGSSCFSVMKDAGFFYNVAGENIAAGGSTPAQTFDQWMNSTAHRENLLGKDFTHIGIGFYYNPDSEYKYYWSMFLVGVRDMNGIPVVYDDQYIPEREKGDVDGSKLISTDDAWRILLYASKIGAGIDPARSEEYRNAADVDSNGVVNAVDASILMSYTAAAGTDLDIKITDFIW